MSWEIVNGARDKGSIKLYGLSTCIWCKKAKSLLDEADVKYQYIYADLLDEKSHMDLIFEMSEYVENISFPTIVVDEDVVIAGYDEEEIKEIIGG